MRNNLIKQLEAYQGHDVELQSVPKFTHLIGTQQNCFYRDCFDPGHMTGSALLINPTSDKVLLNHHKIFDKWLGFGGHADGEEDIAAVALREAIEESGIADIDFVTRDIFDIDIHPVGENPRKQEPAHYHYDVIFLLRAQTEDFHLSDESVDLRWCTYDEAMPLVQNETRMKRILSKWKKADF